MSRLCLVLGDQLSDSLASIRSLELSRDVILMVESRSACARLPFHRQKLVLILSAMRHFAARLRSRGYRVHYVSLGEDEGGITGELERAVAKYEADSVAAVEPSEWRVFRALEQWGERAAVPLDILEDDRFLCSHAEFNEWASSRKSLRMEYFYRGMRRKTGWLMEDGNPVGGRWNYDAENRRRLSEDIGLYELYHPAADEITREVIKTVEMLFPDHYGDLEPFRWAVTREDALLALGQFIQERLPDFGAYQDAMSTCGDFLFHSVLSPYINLGLLLPGEVCEAALESYQLGQAPLNAVEGFIRQVLGWREYMRGVYWLLMPGYEKTNHFEATRSLPGFYWTGETDMFCMKEALRTTRHHAYAHHIQRLMLTGNFALLAGLKPAEVEAWYRVVYADAFDWVELPNTHGMALFADGGLLSSKPYAASGAYINRMSDYCRRCCFDHRKKLGEAACPFNYLYWDFLIRNEQTLRENPRMALALRNLDRKTDEDRSVLQQQASEFLDALE